MYILIVFIFKLIPCMQPTIFKYIIVFFWFRNPDSMPGTVLLSWNAEETIFLDNLIRSRNLSQFRNNLADTCGGARWARSSRWLQGNCPAGRKLNGPLGKVGLDDRDDLLTFTLAAGCGSGWMLLTPPLHLEVHQPSLRQLILSQSYVLGLPGEGWRWPASWPRLALAPSRRM